MQADPLVVQAQICQALEPVGKDQHVNARQGQGFQAEGSI